MNADPIINRKRNTDDNYNLMRPTMVAVATALFIRTISGALYQSNVSLHLIDTGLAE